ncbi:MAG: DEAD/DEAH box helicase, partial [Myxococcales bacterium]|nr:DEAD/DEAH box helicase [Myxococcales bacterium]
RERWAERASPACEREAARAACAEAAACLPFELTRAQRRVIDEICVDMASERPMHRLLQGDVGAGKTAVAFAAAAAAMSRGLQVAMMAPTEILAEQHHAVLAPWCQALGKRCALLTASTPRAARETLLALADAGEIHMLVGTHALLAERVQLPSLGLCIIDEQHRFGVLQRARLRERAGVGLMPHLLVMTATPIPRTMALTVYGDLDLSLLDELPPGRIPAETALFSAARLEGGSRPFQMARARLDAGEQVFVVAPLVQASEALAGVADAESSVARLRAAFSSARVGLVHGRLASHEREAVLGAFRQRELDVLVATTVIEVGLDVPGATVMVVESAERFGLAQLHQLRGRVGRRAGARPLCLLLSGEADVEQSRLEVLTRSSDGFVIAEADLAHRGPGELFGTRQSGVPRLRFADLERHIALLAEAQRAARDLLASDPRLERPEHQQARLAMERRFGEQPLPGAEAG